MHGDRPHQGYPETTPKLLSCCVSSFFAGHGFHLIQSIHYIHHSSNQTPQLAPCPPCLKFSPLGTHHCGFKLWQELGNWCMQIHQTSLVEDQKACHQKWFPGGQRKGFAGRNDLLCFGGKIVECSDTTSHTFHKSVDPCRPSIVWEYNRNKVSICIVFPAAKSACPRVSKWTIWPSWIHRCSQCDSMRLEAKRTSWKRSVQAKCLAQFENFTTVPILIRTFNT